MKTLRILSIALASLVASSAFAQVTIDQNKAMAGGVTPGDTAGFPITISQPGSYKLTGNLSVPQGVKGIVITANNVTLDLNGFTVAGPSTCTRVEATKAVTCSYFSYASVGIETGSTSGAVVRNGIIKGFGGMGLSTGDLGRYDDLRVTENYAGAVDGTSQAFGSTYANCTFDTNSGHGVALNRGLITNSRAINNGGNGLSGLAHLLVSESQAIGNGGNGLNGVAVRGTQSAGNGSNRFQVTSMGGNLDGSTPF